MPRTSSDPLKAFVSLRNSLESERQALSARLAQIEAALGSMPAAASAPVRGMSPRPAVATPATPGRKRAKNEISLKDAVLQVTSKAALTKPEILTAVTKLGYQFSAKDPMNSLNTLLYGTRPKFKNNDGKFSLN